MKKLSAGLIAVIVLVVVVVMVGGSLMGAYNGMATLREKVNTQQAEIQTQLQRRADLIPNLVNSVKGLAAHEQEVIDSVTSARAQLTGAKGMEEQAAANDQLSGALSRLLMVVENYPDIKADAAYISLMDELSGTENRIAVSRGDYNNSVNAYNSKLITFPNNIIAGMFNFDKAEYFTAPESAQSVPEVNFG